jgi:hypothetical protein
MDGTKIAGSYKSRCRSFTEGGSEDRRGKENDNGGRQVKIGSQKDMQMRPFGIDA